MTITARGSLAAAAGLLASGAALSHHSPAAFDMTAEVVIEGTLAKVDWTNPHVYLTVETKGPDGRPLLQHVEGLSISSTQSSGLKRELLTLGSAVVVRAHPPRRGMGTVLGADITMGDGRIYALGGDGRSSRPPAATVRASGLAGNWAPKIDPRLVPTVHGWPLTDKARAALAAVMTGETLTIGCTALPLPMLAQVPVLRTIDVGDDLVLMRFDADGVDVSRTIHVDATEHPDDVEPSLLGHSIGRWEGATLVIDTVGFEPHQLGVGFGIPSGAGKHMIERLTLAADGLQLRYELTLEDPEYLAAPASYSAMWDHRPELAHSNVPCDPETAERFRAE